MYWSRRHACAGQDARIAAEASRFLQISAPSLLLNAVAICLRNHLMAQLDVVVASRAPCALSGLEACCWHAGIKICGAGCEAASLSSAK